MIDKFLADLYIPGCVTQICTENQVIDTIGKNTESIQALLEFWSDHNLYFVAGVDENIGKRRASDDDIKLKNYVYVDLDIRKHYNTTNGIPLNLTGIYNNININNLKGYTLTDKDIKVIGLNLKGILDNNNINYKYITYTGNGLHVYMFSQEPFEIKNKSNFKLGLLEQINKLESILGVDGLDRSCINPARLARLPGSNNCKKDKKPVEILYATDNYSKVIPLLEQLGEQKAQEMAEENRKRALEIQSEFGGDEGAFAAINMLPIGQVVSVATGWAHENGHFTEPGKDKEKACFVPQGQNFLVHGNTDHLPSDQIGFSPFTFVKAYFKLGNKETFKWFKERYASIADISRKELLEKSGEQPGPSAMSVSGGKDNIGSAFDELENVKFDQLLMGDAWDEHKFIIRGAVTRINAYSNIGKSKLCYYFAHRLLEKGYSGIIFSTEVVRSIVLANLLIVQTGEQFWDIVKKKVEIKPEMKQLYQNLFIFDVNHTQNKLSEMERLIKENAPVDFVMIDFVQGVTPKYPSADEYSRMTHYALEIQRMAQENNVALIDLSQISNNGVKDEGASSGFIPSKGSGHLVSSADIGILLKRNKNDPTDNTMKFDIRKHKYLPTAELTLECDFPKGRFKVFGDWGA